MAVGNIVKREACLPRYPKFVLEYNVELRADGFASLQVSSLTQADTTIIRKTGADQVGDQKEETKLPCTADVWLELVESPEKHGGK